MAINVPMPSLPGDALLKGLDSGSNMFAKIMNARYNSSLHPSGDVANAMYVEQLKNQYGENDPRYLEAKRAHDMALSGHQSLIDYRDVLNQTAGPRFSSTLGKTILEGKGEGAADIIKNRGKRGSGIPATAVSKTGEQYYDAQGQPVYADDEDTNPRTPEERTAYERAINKQTGDADARNTYLRAQNLDKTRQAINVEDLTRYSGLKGSGQYAMESLKAALGNPSEQYLAHAKAMNSASLMADQMRQFYKDSIQPSAMDRLRELSNPSAWYKDPKVAIAQFEQLNKILDQETETYEKAGTSPIKLNKLEYKDGKFKVSGNQTPAAADKVEAQEQITGGYPDNGEADDQILAANAPALIKINPKYTKENLKHTAKINNMTVSDLINQLLARGQ